MISLSYLSCNHPTPSFEAMFCFIGSRRRLVVVRYWMIFFLLIDIYVRHGEQYPLLPLSLTLTFDISSLILSQLYFFYKSH